MDRPSFDPRELADKAWTLFSNELREEGVTFVDDSDAEKLIHRCFRLAEIFIRQRQRRQHSPSTGPQTDDRDRRREEPQPPEEEPQEPANSPDPELSSDPAPGTPDPAPPETPEESP